MRKRISNCCDYSITKDEIGNAKYTCNNCNESLMLEDTRMREIAEVVA